MTAPTRILVVGAGLIGTSVGLALADRVDVLLDDASPEHLAEAVHRRAGRPWVPGTAVDLVLACVPPAAVPAVVEASTRLQPEAIVSHVASRQAHIQAEIETAVGARAERVCGGHPLAGRERGGPAAARADLFDGRPWAVCPGERSSRRSVDAVRALAAMCGAEPVELAPEEHDDAVALVSHLPHVAASAVAAQLLTGDATRVAALAGPGLHDTTRVAAGDPALWLDILTGNARRVGPRVAAVAQSLSALAAALETLAEDAADESARAVVAKALADGNAGRARVPLKGRAARRDLVAVVVAVPDRPGQLAGALACAAAAGVNVEDVRVEHLSGRPRGLLELLVDRSSVDAAKQALAGDGWHVVGP